MDFIYSHVKITRFKTYNSLQQISWFAVTENLCQVQYVQFSNSKSQYKAKIVGEKILPDTESKRNTASSTIANQNYRQVKQSAAKPTIHYDDAIIESPVQINLHLHTLR